MALKKSGYIVALWLPQMARLVTAVTSTPAFLASCDLARFSSSAVMAKKRFFGTPGALFAAMSELVLHGLPTTSTRDVARGVLGDGIALAGENFAVDAEQILALHAGLARHGADEQRPVHALETFVEIRGRHEAFEQRERAVVEFHADAVQRGHGFFIGDFDEVEDDRLVRAERRAGGDAEQE